MADNVRFTLNDRQVEIVGVPPMTTLLDWLRDDRGLRGTKEGCAEGDCGACTVVLEREGRRDAVNSCILLLGQLDGQSVRTVEGLRGADGGPHPVQVAMAEADATQCGFCTPGFVMSALAYASSGGTPDPKEIHEVLAGNLCRCTGYRPIVEAMTRIAGLAVEPAPALSPAAPRPTSTVFEDAFFAPRSLDELLALRAAHPEALLLAGGTDLGLLASRERKPPKAVIHLMHVPELAAISATADRITIGAAATYTEAAPTLVEAFPALRSYLSRLGSRQIRNMGTIGGNIGTASPIGDMPPVLLALEASLTLVSKRGAREIPLDDFFLDYRKKALAPDEIIQSLSMPRLWEGETFHCDKVSKRRDQDISTVAGAYRVRIRNGRIEDARLAFGGMAATPRRAHAAEAALLKDGFAAAIAAVEGDFKPVDDWRGSAAYRRQVAANLLRRLELRLAEPGRVLEVEVL
ncbi:MAG: xanthine dehydrogenase small subunit [Reyranella sp.]|uniref:xanthine dehydrogenase small subunit n=1 Tax=Reyranella sp. TaxID=1929291 RepID=UPI00121A0129|nr:xanthine dehydrogenase small subunit [Reyranella sp.]TAJ91295.1 MAG: xanthine dehydrogenase small subunit [Reyranella sp.]TBR27552.1 MAG: xanthine dehydrogenase small subunit [Reyranella sp.]